MDTTTVIEDGQVTYSEDLEWRVKLYQDWQRDGYAETIVHANGDFLLFFWLPGVVLCKYNCPN